MSKLKIRCIMYMLITGIIISSGFGCAKKTPSEQIVIKVNDYTLTTNEFNALFAELKTEDTTEARKAFLDNLVIQKLILQEAQQEGLDKKEDFLKAVENFWQQSLLKIAVDKKIKEISGSIRVREDEIEDYYNKWKAENPDNPKTLAELHDLIKLQIMRQKQALILNSWVDELRKKSNIKIDKEAIGIE